MKKTGSDRPRPTRFNPQVRERFLTLIEAGRSQEEAAAAVGMSAQTVQRWKMRGEREAGTPHAEFAERLVAATEGVDESLAEPDVRRRLEKKVRDGSVSAMKLWFDRYAPKGPDADQAENPTVEEQSWIDELAQRRRPTG